MAPKRIIVAITGATGVIYGIKLLEALQDCAAAEAHLSISKNAEKIIELETAYTTAAVLELADCHYDPVDIGAAVASGSYPVDGMVVLPCSMKSLASIAHGLADNLITRAADVSLKEGRKLIISPRETPLSLIHL
jgi:4-hydroxy-3-polyprenylbenzoate decarboxylase